MITHQLSDNGILVLHPSGPVSAADFASLTKTVDPWIEAGNRLKGLIIDAPDFPGWKDFAGFSAHLKFIRDHHREIPRVAIVSDSSFLTGLPRIGRHFVHAEIKHFPSGQLLAATEWLIRTPDPDPEAIRHAWFPEQKLIWIRVNGRIETGEYKNLLEQIKPAMQSHAPVSFLVDIDDLEGVDFGALLADARFGFSHYKDIKRIALVGHQKWCQKLASLPNPFPIEIKTFDEEAEYEAWSWLGSD